MRHRLSKRSMALLLVAAIIVTSIPVSVLGLTEKKSAETKYFYDFTENAESKAEGYQGVDSNTLYSEETGYGWRADTAANVSGALRTAAKTSTRERGIAYGTETAVFCVDVEEAGTYLISAAIGDRQIGGIETKNMDLSVNGEKMLSAVNVEAGMTKECCFTAEASADKQLVITVSGDSWTLASLEIRKYSDYESNKGTKYFIAAPDGNIVIETETAMEQSEYAWTAPGSEAAWTPVYGVSGYGMQYGPNTTVGKAYTNFDTASASAPKMHFQVNFEETGTYIVWALVKASCADDDSVFVLIDNKSNAMPFTNDCGDTKGEYVWKKMQSGINLVVSEPGVHTISVYGREDGLAMDKLILTKDTAFTPSDLGGKMYREKDVTATDSEFPLFANGEPADIYIDTSNEYESVVRAAKDLCNDIRMVTGTEPRLVNQISEIGEVAVIAGTIGKNEVIDALIASGQLDVSGVENEWEAFTIQYVENPTDNIGQALVIAGSDKRGTIYGIYDLSEQIGVSPWYWWADVPVKQKQEVILQTAETEKTEKPDVKYRGIFLNDEENFTVWTEKFENDTDSQGTPNTGAYEKVFELLLRLKANTLWPAMHEQSDAFNKYLNPETGTSYCAEAADRYGIIMSSSHCEMLLANNPTEWVPWCEANQGKYNLKKINNDWKSSYDYTVNSEAMNAYWEERVAQNYKFENIYMLGLRAVHDAGILHSGLGSNPTYEQKAAVVKQAVEAQVAILEKYEKKYEEETGEKIVFAKSFCPYKEAAEYYKYDLSLPEETIILWADDNYGYVRQFPTEAELNKYAGSGVYYHVSYWGWPCSYLWMATTPLSLVYEEMHKAYTAGSNDYWILNVGDLKPSEIPMEFFLKLGWDINFVKEDTIRDYLGEKFAKDFTVSEETGKEIANILTEVYQICNAKKPEFQGLNQGSEYSLTDYGDEGQKVVNRMTEILAKSQGIYDSLPESEKDAYYELVHYMVKSVKLTLEKNIYAQKSQLYAAQGRFLSVNAYADAAYAAYEGVLDEIDYYNLKVANGKWQGILDPYQNVNGLPKIDTEPDVTRVNSDLAEPGIGAVCEGQSTGFENEVLSFDSVSDGKKFLDIFTTGFDSAVYQITTDAWVYLTDSEGNEPESSMINGKRVYTGEVDIETRFWIGIDWSQINTDKADGEIVVTDDTGFRRSFALECKKSAINPETESKTGYYESNGIVSIEAEHYSNNVAVGGQEWRVFHDLGNSGDSMKVYPDTSYANKCLFSSNTAVSEAIKKAPYIEYNVYFETTGTYTGSFYRLPTLNEGTYDDGGAKSCRVLVGMDDGVATLLRCNSVVGEYGGSLWSYGVQENQNIHTFTVQVDAPGWHTMRVIKADAGITFDKIVLTHSDTAEKSSLLGAPESYQTICATEETAFAALPVFDKNSIAVEEGKTVEKRLYDFTANASQIQSGYISVTAETVSKKYGWSEDSVGKVKAEYRSNASKTSNRDKGFVYGTEPAVFEVKDLKPGTYNVGVAAGDRDGNGKTVKNMTVDINGVQVLKGIQVDAGNTSEYSAIADVSEDGTMKLTFSGDLWAVTSLEIWPYTEPRKDNGTGAFAADYKGDINIEAEAALENSDYAKIIAAKDSSGTTWMETNGISGTGLFFGPNSTRAYTNTSYSQNDAPKAEYQVYFSETGSYNIWILTKLESQEDDSVLVSVDENTASYINDIMSTDGEYVWKRMATTSISSAGIHKISIIGREDGLAFDKLVITKSSAAPTGTGGKMVRQGATLDTSELEAIVEEAKKVLEDLFNAELQELVDQAEALLSGNPSQEDIDRMYDQIKDALSKEITESKDYTVLQRAIQMLKSGNLPQTSLKEYLRQIYENLQLLKEVTGLKDADGKMAQYDFEGNWQNTLNPEETGTPGHMGNGTTPEIVTDSERGNVLRVRGNNVDNTSYFSVPNPFKGKELEDGATISIWVKSSDIDNYGFIWSAGTKYSFVWMAGAPYFGYDGSSGYIDMNCPHNLPGSSDKQGYLKNGEWNLVTTTITDENVVVYVNGNKILETADKNYTAGYNTDHMTRITTLLKTVDTLEIGGKNKHWGSASMLADGFTLYDRALTAEEAVKEYVGGMDKDILSALIAYGEEEASKTDVYTEDSIAAYREVLEAAKQALAEGAEPEELITVYAELYEAEKLLVKANEEPEENPTEPGEEPTEPGEVPTEPGENPTEPGEEPTKPGNSDSDIPDTGKNEPPATGDVSNMVYLLLLFSAAGVAILCTTRKKENLN